MYVRCEVHQIWLGIGKVVGAQLCQLSPVDAHTVALKTLMGNK